MFFFFLYLPGWGNKQTHTHTHAEWEDWESLSPVGSKSKAASFTIFMIIIILSGWLHLRYSFLQMPLVVCGYDELQIS